MIKLLSTLLLFGILISCTNKTTNETIYTVRNDIRWGRSFFSIFIQEDGRAYVVKGTGTFYTDSLKIISADTSAVFTLDSSKVYFRELNNIKSNPIIDSSRSDAPRIEIYYHQKKIYDSYFWGEPFWKMFRPIMGQLPKGFSPFRVNEKPFG